MGLRKVHKKVLPLLKALEIVPKKFNPKKVHKRVPIKGFQKSSRKECKNGAKKVHGKVLSFFKVLEKCKKSVLP